MNSPLADPLDVQAGTVTQTQTEEWHRELVAAFEQRPFRIELDTRISLSQGGMVGAQLWTRKPNGRWAKVGPVLLPPKGASDPHSAADALRQLADLVDPPPLPGASRGTREVPVSTDWDALTFREASRLDHVHDLEGKCRKSRWGTCT